MSATSGVALPQRRISPGVICDACLEDTSKVCRSAFLINSFSGCSPHMSQVSNQGPKSEFQQHPGVEVIVKPVTLSQGGHAVTLESDKATMTCPRL